MAKRIMVSTETSQEIRTEIGNTSGKARTKLVERIAQRLGFSTHTIESHARQVPRNAAITLAPTTPTFEYQHDAPVDVLADLLLMQVNLAVWARRNGDYSIKLQELAVAIDTSITAIESAQAFLSLEEENQDLASQLQSADAQLKVLQDIIDREREARRQRDSPHIRGD